MTDSVLLFAARAETDALSKAIATLHSEPDGLDRLAKQLELLTAHCVAYPAETRRLWDWFERQEPCMEAGELSEVLMDHLGLIDERIRLVQEVQTLTAEVGDGQASRKAALAAAFSDLLAQGGRLAGLLERLSAPMPPSTEPLWTTADCRAAFERGEYETIESIIARVQAGGPVSTDDAE